MSILDGLITFDVLGGYLTSVLGKSGEYVRRADVREALTNPSDEQVDEAARKVAANMELWPEQCVDDEWAKLPPVEREDWRALVRESWAAAAGVDQ